MRILWSLPVPGQRPDSPRGDVVRARSLVKGLEAAGHDVCVVAAGGDRQTGRAVSTYRRVVRTILPGPAALTIRDAGRLVLARRHARRVANAARSHRSEVIVETQVHLVPSGRLAQRLSGLPLVLDDCSPPEEEAHLGSGLPRWSTARSFRAQAAAARSLVVSSRALAEILEPWGNGKLHVVPNGVNGTAFAPGDRAQVRQRMGLGESPVIVFVGSFQPWHRLDLLVSAAARLPDSLRPQLLLVGEGPTRQAVLAEARRRGIAEAVRAPGAVQPEEVPVLLAAGDVGVLPGSNHWGQPMKVAEYAAAGLATVAPDLPPVLEVIRPDTTGLVFPPNDEDGLLDTLERVLADPSLRTRLGRAARGAAERWSWSERARALEAVLEVVAGRPRKASGGVSGAERQPRARTVGP